MWLRTWRHGGSRPAKPAPRALGSLSFRILAGGPGGVLRRAPGFQVVVETLFDLGVERQVGGRRRGVMDERVATVQER